MSAGRVVAPQRPTGYDVSTLIDPRYIITHPSPEDLRAARDYVIARYGTDPNLLAMLGLDGAS